MRVLLAATMAASALAIGLKVEPAASLPPGSPIIDPSPPIHRVQQKDMMSPGLGMGSPGARGPAGGGKMRPGDRGMRDDGPRTGQRFGGDRDRPRHGRPSYGFSADCGWLRRRALDTGSRYWWRQYQACMR